MNIKVVGDFKVNYDRLKRAALIALTDYEKSIGCRLHDNDELDFAVYLRENEETGIYDVSFVDIVKSFSESSCGGDVLSYEIMDEWLNPGRCFVKMGDKWIRIEDIKE